MMKAWLVYEREDPRNGEIVLAETSGKAKMKTWAADGVSNPITDLNVRRAPKLDGKELTCQNILSAGYEIDCQ